MRNRTLDLLDDYNPRSRLESFDVKRFNKFKGWLDEQKTRKGEGEYYSTNYKYAIVKIIKIMLKSADEQEDNLEVCQDYKKFKNYKWQETEIFALTQKQVDDFEAVDISHLPKGYEIAKGIFLMATLTGLRRIDIVNFNTACLVTRESNGVEIITLRQTKTKRSVSIPISSRAKPYVKEYKQSESTTLSNIRVVADMAGIEDYAKIGVHTGRRTHATLAYEANVPIKIIRGILGHKTETQTMEYIGVTPEQVAKEAAKYKHYQ